MYYFNELQNMIQYISQNWMLLLASFGIVLGIIFLAYIYMLKSETISNSTKVGVVLAGSLCLVVLVLALLCGLFILFLAYNLFQQTDFVDLFVKVLMNKISA